MSNRNLVLGAILLIVGMLILFTFDFKAILSGEPLNQKYLKFNDVQSIAIEHNQLLYTLNFDQQNQVINILNESIPIEEIKSDKRVLPNITKIVIYSLKGKPEIVLTPIAYVDNDLIYSAPDWAPNGFLMEVSEGALRNIFSQAYD